MTTHPTADAFVRKLLERPADATARLVFADWLEETGAAHNAAWAYYIRLRTEADRHPPAARERAELERQAASYVRHIRAELALPAARFVGHPKSLLQLLPAPNLTVRLGGFTPPAAVRELLPESVARENLLFPLDYQPGTLLLAGADPWNVDTLQKLQFILNRDIVLVRGAGADVRAALDRTYGTEPIEVVESVLYEFADTGPGAPPAPEPFPSLEQLVRFVHLMLADAFHLRAARVRVEPDAEGVGVRFEIDGRWFDRDRVSQLVAPRLLEALVWLASVPLPRVPGAGAHGSIDFAHPAGRFPVAVHMHYGPHGPGAVLTFDPPPGRA